MKTTVLNRADVEGKNNKQIADKINGKETDTQKGATVAETVLKAEPRPGETKSIADVMETIRNKAKLVADLQATIDRRNTLQSALSEGKISVSIRYAESNRSEIISFNNENTVDYIVKMLVEKSKEIEAELAANLIALEK